MRLFPRVLNHRVFPRSFIFSPSTVHFPASQSTRRRGCLCTCHCYFVDNFRVCLMLACVSLNPQSSVLSTILHLSHSEAFISLPVVKHLLKWLKDYHFLFYEHKQLPPACVDDPTLSFTSASSRTYFLLSP